MSEHAYDATSLTGNSIRFDGPMTNASPRLQQVKRLDDALARLENAVEQLQSAISPAMRPGGTVRPLQEEQDKAIESDVVAHLRHTTDRVLGVEQSIRDYIDCLDL